MLMNTIANQANFTVIYSISERDQNWGMINKDGSSSGMMKTLLDEEADIGLGALATLYYRHWYFDTSVTYLQESITWCVPHAMPEPKWKCLLIIYHKITWLSLYISYLVVSLTISIINGKKKRVKTMQEVFSIMLGIALPKLTKSTPVRIILMVWMLICLILNALYHSSLISFLTSPNYEPQIETLDDMIEANYKFGVVPPSFLFMKNENSTINQLELESCENVKLCLDRTAYQRDYVVGK